MSVDMDSEQVTNMESKHKLGETQITQAQLSLTKDILEKIEKKKENSKEFSYGLRGLCSPGPLLHGEC